MISAPPLQIAQLTFSIYDQFSFCSRTALRKEESNWATECHLWFSHLCCIQPKFWKVCIVSSLFSQTPQRMSKSSLLEIPPDLVHSRIPKLCLRSPVYRKPNQKLPMMPLFVLFLTHQLLYTACPQSSSSRSSLLVRFFWITSNIPSRDSSSSSFHVSTSTRDSTTGSMSSPMGTASRFRVVVGLTSALLCHARSPTVDSPSQDTARRRSHCRFLPSSLLGSGRNWERPSRDRLEWCRSFHTRPTISQNEFSFPDQFYCESEPCQHHCVPHRSLDVLCRRCWW